MLSVAGAVAIERRKQEIELYGTLSDPVLRTGFGLEAVDDGWVRARSAKYPAVEADIARAMVSMAMTAL